MESVGAIGRWKPYPEYKDSGVEWLGEVPEHWDVRKIKHIAENTSSSVDKHTLENEASVRLCNYVDVYKNEFIDGTFDFMDGTASRDEIRRFSLKQGDVLITKDSESWTDIAIPTYVKSNLPRILCGYHLSLVRIFVKEILGEYLLRAFQAQPINYQFQISANGITRFGLGKDAIDNGLLPVPPFSEQKSIIFFLNRETAKIDALITKKKLLIKLLQEKRTSLISQAVTKGINLNAPMKDSSLEWLGEIPEGWSLIKNGYLFSERDERGFPELPLLNVSIHTGVSLREFSNEHIEQMAADWATYKKACKNDIAFNKMRMWQGAVGVTPEDGLVSPDYIVAKPNDNVNPFFYEYFFRTSIYREEINRSSHGIVPDRNRLYWDQFKDMLSINPPKIVQDTIVEYLNDYSRMINGLIQRMETVIENLQEYRAALITAAVTGKIDVRDHTPSDALNDL